MNKLAKVFSDDDKKIGQETDLVNNQENKQPRKNGLVRIKSKWKINEAESMKVDCSDGKLFQNYFCD
jgi:hypothetical protein